MFAGACAQRGLGASAVEEAGSWLFYWQLRPARAVLRPARAAAIKSVLLRFAP
ncbi:hypothetical protein A2U01_0118358 [Trifolium medium]|uniref:Uncharacterized protein n=1 Tax=Trifolium medium TaxID=97028 RepID=A0A392W8Q6_9FABA|nr:hypothetical protein [Trifolium medium]